MVFHKPIITNFLDFFDANYSALIGARQWVTQLAYFLLQMVMNLNPHKKTNKTLMVMSASKSHIPWACDFCNGQVQQEKLGQKPIEEEKIISLD